VAGGAHTYTTVVEIFKPDTSQWYRTDPLPRACCDASLTTIGNTCYALGGYRHPTYLNQALYASIDDLFGNAVPANYKMPTQRNSSDTWSAWRTLPNTPTYEPAAVTLAGSLLAIGGKETYPTVVMIRRKSASTLPSPTPGSISVIYQLHG
jgi:hypothetical protein